MNRADLIMLISQRLRVTFFLVTSLSAANAIAQGEWITLIDGTEGIENFNPLGMRTGLPRWLPSVRPKATGPPGWSAGKTIQILKSASNFGHHMMPTAVFIFAVRTPSGFRSRLL